MFAKEATHQTPARASILPEQIQGNPLVLSAGCPVADSSVRKDTEVTLLW